MAQANGTEALSDCGCCEGIAAATPARVTNRAGLSVIAYRSGQRSAFRASMLARLSAGKSPALGKLTTRADDDFTIALADAWATSLDVLTFYQERIANESYLRTSTERQSLLYLARLIGYELRPGVAAGTSLAFTVDNAPGAPKATTIDVGVKVQSVPAPGELPQTFETAEAIEARGAWNAIQPRMTTPLALSTGMSELWLKDGDANLKTGDRVLIVAQQEGGGVARALRRIKQVKTDDANKRTQVILEPDEYWYGTTQSSALTEAGVWAMRAKAAPFGHNVPPKTSVTTTSGTSTPQYEEWDFKFFSSTLLSLDAVYDQIQTGSIVVIDRPAIFGLVRWLIIARASHVRSVSCSDYGMSARVTNLTLDTSWLRFISYSSGGYTFTESDDDLAFARDTTVYAQSEKLDLAEAPITTAVQGNVLVLNGAYPELIKGRAIAVSGELDGSADDSPRASEIATIQQAVTIGGFTQLQTKQALSNTYKRATARINANVARATHGETVREVLGGGDASKPYRRFTLRQPPMTYISARNDSGAESTLELRVNDVLWHETPTLLNRASNEHIFVTRTDDDRKTIVQFGDGLSGARPATGVDNIRAVYRKGIGAGGNLKAEQLSLLMTRPLGVKEVINPEAASGGADRESRDDARGNAPLTVLTLDRIVSLRDYEDFARAFAGVAKALATWTWDGETRGVFVTVAGVNGAEIAPSSDTYQNLVAAMRAAGDPYVPLRVQTYAPAMFVLKAQVTRHPDYLSERVQADAEAAVQTRFSFAARAFGQAVALSEVMAVMQGVPGVVGVDVDVLRRTDVIGGSGLLAPLLAALPQGGTTKTLTPAELLLLDTATSEVSVP